ncbi:olfactory receptor 52N2-like [Pelodiscus sinensis]|uniref:olfactory receptor 52N2-like n=1 Tax=Pelodiscus sinensis TaxID=13735 RepID=UPI0003C49EE0|nr:olfactory receptor 52N2-like [Pelodiscus sinensis]|eukprot:XP_006120220.1 olfactory receptor 52N2-like [Pelodiscus sinensis]
MEAANSSTSEMPVFILMGIPGLEDAHIWISIPLAAFYVTALLANSTVLSVVAKEQCLHKPMYLMICMLALSDIITSTSFMPKTLCIFWFNLKSITLNGCLTQLFFFQASSAVHSGVLVIMAVDRYVAICNPLRYTTILTNARTAKLGLVCLVRAVLFILPMPLLLRWLPFCSNNIIAHTYCDNMAVAKVSCGDITGSRIYGLMLACIMIGFDLTVIALSYALILRALLRLSSKKANQKALSTCTAHILVILMAYPAGLFSSLAHRFGQGITPYVHIISSNLHYIIPPMLNPIVYGVNTKELREKVVAFLGRTFSAGVFDYKTAGRGKY